MDKFFNKFNNTFFAIIAFVAAGFYSIDSFLMFGLNNLIGFTNDFIICLLFALFGLLLILKKDKVKIVYILLLGLEVFALSTSFSCFSLGSDYIDIQEYYNIGTLAVAYYLNGFAYLILFNVIVLQLLPMFVEKLEDKKVFKLITTIGYFVVISFLFIGSFLFLINDVFESLDKVELMFNNWAEIAKFIVLLVAMYFFSKPKEKALVEEIKEDSEVIE